MLLAPPQALEGWVVLVSVRSFSIEEHDYWPKRRPLWAESGIQSVREKSRFMISPKPTTDDGRSTVLTWKDTAVCVSSTCMHLVGRRSKTEPERTNMATHPLVHVLTCMNRLLFLGEKDLRFAHLSPVFPPRRSNPPAIRNAVSSRETMVDGGETASRKIFGSFLAPVHRFLCYGRARSELRLQIQLGRN